MSFKTIETEVTNQVGTIWLNRPEIHNAFNEIMISEITKAIQQLGKLPELRVIVLRGRGKSFCAGADLNWMREVKNYSFEENYNESFKLSECFYAIYTCPIPTIAIVHGAAIGGANGLLAACDMAYCEDETVFSLSEVKIGIVPACISPYVIKRTGEFPARDLMITGRRIQGKEAEKYKLVNQSFSAFELDEYLKKIIELIKTSGPKAVTLCKELIHNVSNTYSLEAALGETARIIAEIRSSHEGQEGMAAFLEKRKPNWVTTKDQQS
jgi:methylglutaconyl-CoA hydratase